MEVADSAFTMSMGSNVLMTVAPDGVDVVNGSYTESLLTLNRSTEIAGNLTVDSNVVISGSATLGGVAIATSSTVAVAVAAEATRATGVEALKAPLASPTFTGTVSASGNITAMNTVVKGRSYDGVNGAVDASGIFAYAQSLVSDATKSIPNLFVSFGNASDDTITTKTFGTQSNGAPVPSNPYFRTASETKVTGAVVLAKMLEERWVTMETLVDTFLGNSLDNIYDFSGNLLKHPWLIQNKSFGDNSGNFYWGYDHVPNMLAPRFYSADNPDCVYFNYDASGKLISGHTLDASGVTTITTVNNQLKWAYGPIVNFYNSVHNTTKGPSDPLYGAEGPIQINIKSLASMALGINYDAYWALMNFQGIIQACNDYDQAHRIAEWGYVGFYAVIASGQLNGPITNPRNPTPVNQINNYGPDQYLGRLSTMPFSSFPFEYYSYSMEYDILGFFMDQVIKQNTARRTQYTDVYGYLNQKLLAPLGITDFWMFYGQTQPPADASSNMMSASEWRNSTVSTSKYGVDGQWWEFGYGFDGSYNTLKWSDQNPGNSNSTLNNELYYMNKNTNVKHIGTFNAGCACSVNSYSKLLRLYCNKGYDVVSKTRLISKGAMHYIMQPSTSLSTELVDMGNISARQLEDLQTIPALIWSFGGFMVPMGGWVLEEAKPLFSNIGATSLGPIQIQPYPLAPGSRFWSGSVNTFWYCNVETGAWIHVGTQQLIHSRRSGLTFSAIATSLTTPFISILESSS